VPVEVPIYRTLEQAVAGGRLRPSASAAPGSPFLVEPGLPDDAAAMLERTDEGACVFLEAGSRLCIVHRDLGETALPATCRHFPRLALRDSRGTFITLSHFCPTAASMLFREDIPLAIVHAPPAFPPLEYEGLVVTEEDLPPLLSPAMLMDPAGYSAWERHMVSRCAEVSRSPESVVATLCRDARLLRVWKPGEGTLVDAVGRLPESFVPADPPGTLLSSLVRHEEVMAAVPDDLRPAPDPDGLEAAWVQHVRPVWGAFHGPLDHYLGAKAFAAWTAYQGRGVSTIVDGLDAALGLVRVEAARQCRDAGGPLDAVLLLQAIRSADFALNHLAVGEDLALAWVGAEH
jgi:hypothetical protein